MKKIALLITLTLISAHTINGMETERQAFQYLYESCSPTFAYLYSYLPALFSQAYKDSQSTQNLQKNRADFENTLQLYHLYPKGNSNVDIGYFALYSTTKDMFNALVSPIKHSQAPMRFLIYCYYQKFHSKEDGNLDELAFSEDLLKYKNANVDGYSAIGAAILAKDVSIENKRNFIQQLLDLGFQPTNKDMILAELVLYDAIPANEKEKMMLFLRQKDLLLDVKKKIIGCMVQPYRIKFWPLPDTIDNKK